VTLQATLRDRTGREAAHAKEAAEEAKIEAQEAREEAAEAIKAEAQLAKAAAKAAQEKAAKEKAEIEARQHLEEAKQKAHEAQEKVKAEAKEKAHAAKIEAAQAKEEAREQAEAAKAKAEEKKHELKAKADKIEVPRVDLGAIKTADVEVEYADSSSKWLWILTGIIAGALLAIFFAPTTGRRSRAAIKDRLGKVGDGATDAATAASDKIVDIAHRVEGLAHQVETKLAADVSSDDDATIADRVRSTLGHHEVAKTIDRINVDCADGIVTLRGPLLDAATQEAIIAAVKAVPGVKEVVSDFLTDEKPADPSTYAS
jgi:osmotically-inducible protein OsmY